MKKALLIAVTVMAGCTTAGTDADVLQDRSESLGGLELSSGTSFGMCAGYCNGVLTIDSVALTLVETDSRGGLPGRTRTQPLAAADWARIRGLVDVAALTRLEGVHGCPDCADGGAEWVEIDTGTGPIRVTFEFGDTLPGIGPLQAEIRALRERFPG